MTHVPIGSPRIRVAIWAPRLRFTRSCPEGRAGRMPSMSCRWVRAGFTDCTITVYRAYPPQIADAAAVGVVGRREH